MCSRRGRPSRRGRADEAVAAGAVLDDDLLPQPLLQLLRDDARGDVDKAARGEGHEDADWLGRVVLSLRLRTAEDRKRRTQKAGNNAHHRPPELWGPRYPVAHHPQWAQMARIFDVTPV